MATVIPERPEIETRTQFKPQPPSAPKMLAENPVCLALEDLGKRGIFALIYPQDQNGERYLTNIKLAKIHSFKEITPETLSERLIKVGARYHITPRQTIELEENIIAHNYDPNIKDVRRILFDRIPEDLRNYR